MKRDWTPAPWRAEPGGTVGYAVIRDERGAGIGSVVLRDERGEMEANARLIEAAPVLMDFVMSLNDVFEAVHEIDTDDEILSDSLLVWHARLIEFVTGEQPDGYDVRQPSYYVDPEDPEGTFFPPEAQDELERELWQGDVRRIQTYYAGPDVFVARVPVTFDEDGDWDETEVRWHRTEAEARAAANQKPQVES